VDGGIGVLRINQSLGRIPNLEKKSTLSIILFFYSLCLDSVERNYFCVCVCLPLLINFRIDSMSTVKKLEMLDFR
jgi:hypothetical protein